jgi:hypothetical protein
MKVGELRLKKMEKRLVNIQRLRRETSGQCGRGGGVGEGVMARS